MKTIVIKPTGGLCNRFRFIFSFIRKFIDENKFHKYKFIIVWKIDNCCNGHIDCFFQDIENVKFVSNYDKKPYLSGSKIIMKNYNNINYLEKIPIFLNTNMFNKIRKIIMKKLKNNYISIHIRRTDLQNILENKDKRKNKIVSDEKYIEFINKFKKKNISSNR